MGFRSFSAHARRRVLTRRGKGGPGRTPAAPAAEALERRLLCARTVTVVAGGTAALADVDQFADSPAADLRIDPRRLNEAAGNVTLRANTDVIFSADVDIARLGARLTVQAGRSILIDAGRSVATSDGLIDFSANCGTAEGVVAANRLAGAARILMGAGNTVLDAGTNAAALELLPGTGVANAASGNITLGTVAAATRVEVSHRGPTAGGGIDSTGDVPTIRSSAATLDANGAGGFIAAGNVPVSLAPATAGGTVNLRARAANGVFFDMAANGTLNVGSAAAGAFQGVSSTGGSAPVRILVRNTSAAAAFSVGEPITSSGSGSVTLTSSGGFTAAAAVSAAGGAVGISAADGIALTADAADVSTTGNVTLRANTDNDGVGALIGAAGVRVSGNGLVASAATGIDLDTAVQELVASTSAAGAIVIDELDGLALDLQAANGRITVNAAGSTVVTRAVSLTDADANDVTIITSAGDLTVAAVDAGAALGDATLRTLTGQVYDDDDNATEARADVLHVSGPLGIGEGGTATGLLDVRCVTLVAACSGAEGAMFVREADAVTAVLDTIDGFIVLEAGGPVVASRAVAGGTGRNATITAAGDITVTTVTAEGDNVFLTAAGGSIFDDGTNGTRVTAANVQLVAGRAIGRPPSSGSGAQLDTTCATLQSSTAGSAGTAAPGIWLGELDAVTLTRVAAAEGQVVVTAGGATVVTDVSAGGAAPLVLLTATTGNMTVASVAAAGGTVTLSAPAGSILDDAVEATVIAGGFVSLSALGDVGVFGGLNALDTAADTLSLSSTTTTAGTGGRGISVRDVNAVTVENATTADGLIFITANGNLAATNVSAGGAGRAANLSALGGSLSLGVVSAAGDRVNLLGGVISDANGAALNVTTAAVSLTASATAGGVGTAVDPIETAVTDLEASAGTGGVWVSEADGLTLRDPDFFAAAVTATGGGIHISAVGPLRVETDVVLGPAAASGEVVLTAGETVAPAADNLTVDFAVDVRAEGRPVRLIAGDTVELGSFSVVLGASVELRVQALDRDGGGGVVVNTGTLNASTVEVFGGSGNDSFRFALSGVAGVDEPTVVHGGEGVDSLSFSNPQNVATEDVVHLGPSSVGGVPGDNYFGPGFTGGVGFDGVELVEVDVGAASDQVFVLPSAATAFSVRGGVPVPGESGADSLLVATAGATNVQHTTGTTGSGQFTFSNRQPVSYTGIESAAQDASAPRVVAADFDFAEGPHEMTFTFDQDVSRSIAAADVVLTNLTTGLPVPTGAMSLVFSTVFSPSARVTFPGFAGGLLPNGNYRATISAAAVSDNAGNALLADATLDFFVLAGDVNRSRSVTSADFVVLAQNFGRTNRTFGEGDLNGDGLVTGADFLILATNFGRTLPVPPAAPARAAATAAPLAQPARSEPARRKPAPRPAVRAPGKSPAARNARGLVR